MGLEDITSDVQEEVESLDDEDIKEFSDRVETLGQVIMAVDKRLESLEEDVELLRKAAVNDEEVETDDFLEDEHEESEGDGPSWL